MKISLDKCKGSVWTLVSGENCLGLGSLTVGMAVAQLQDRADKETTWLAVTSDRLWISV